MEKKEREELETKIENYEKLIRWILGLVTIGDGPREMIKDKYRKLIGNK